MPYYAYNLANGDHRVEATHRIIAATTTEETVVVAFHRYYNCNWPNSNNQQGPNHTNNSVPTTRPNATPITIIRLKDGVVSPAYITNCWAIATGLTKKNSG